MPNWCDNNLVVTGPKVSITAFRRWLGKDGLRLKKIAPIPRPMLRGKAPHPNPESEEAKKLVTKYGFNNWYDWCVANWGTKWDVDAKPNYSAPEMVTFDFTSAWSPPVPAIETLSARFPQLSFTLKYCECAMGFAGEAHSISGECVDNYYEYSSNPEHYTAIAEFFGIGPEFDEEEGA